MTHTNQTQDCGTVVDTESAEALARTVYAVEGTRSADVLLEMERILSADESSLCSPAILKTVRDPHEIGEGLVLCDGTVRGRKTTFSTRYEHRPEKRQYLLTIGPLLPRRRLRTAACEIIAMLRRGICTWTITDPSGRTRTCRNAYGATAVQP